MKKLTPILIVLLILATSATADSPPRLIYNGYLLDDSGEPVEDSSYTLEFALWDSESGGSQHYTESVTVTTESGFFAAPLYPSPEELPPAGEAWLEVSVNGETTDRQMVGSVPYALTASTAITASTSTETDEYTLSDLVNDEECMSDCIPQWSFADSAWEWTIDSDTLADLSCSTDQIAEYNGSSWQCTDPASGGGAPASVMYICEQDEADVDACPSGWTDATGVNSRNAGCGDSGYGRVCYTSSTCSVMYICKRFAENMDACPSGWADATGVQEENASCGGSGYGRVCYVCE